MRTHGARIGMLWMLAGALACGAGAARADEKPVPLDDVPAKVRDAAAKAAPETKWTKAVKETEDGDATYELTGTDPKGLAVSVAVADDGEVLEVEREVRVDDLPKAVAGALKAFPDVKWKAAAMTAEGDDVTYEINGTNPQGFAFDVWISAEGAVELTEAEIRVDDLPKAAADGLKAIADLKWIEAVKTVEDGEVSYDLKATDAKGRAVVASVSADGHAEVETRLTLADVPEVVSKTLKAKLPMFRPESVSSFAETDEDLVYLFEGAEPGGESIVISVSADGKRIEIVEEED